MGDKDPKRYDNAAWEIIKRLEAFLDDVLRIGRQQLSADEADAVGCKSGQCKTLGQKIELLSYRHGKDKPVLRRGNPCNAALKRINDEVRKKFAHVDDKQKSAIQKSIAPVIIIKKSREYEKFAGSCRTASRDLRAAFGKRTGMEDVMIDALQYPIGNAGDILKHGLLAEFLEWRFSERGCGHLNFFDAFAGRPWGDCGKVRRVLSELGGALGRVYSGEPKKYFGSAFLAANITKREGKTFKIFLNDKNEDARINFEHADMPEGMSFADPPLPDNNGYAILRDKRAANYDLILIDPYANFLRNEFYEDAVYENGGLYFSSILEAANANPNLFIAVFVLDMDHENKVGKRFAEFKRRELAGRAFSIRCPKRITKNESRYNSEILLISKQIAEGKCGNLYEQLRYFAEQAARALPLPQDKPLELWGAGQKGTPNEPEKFYRE